MLFFCMFDRQVLSSLTVVVGVGSAACGLEVGMIVPHDDLTLMLLKDAPTTTAHHFSPVCFPPSNISTSVDHDNCISVALGKC